MATKWGICGAGKISNDFCSAMKLLPASDHEMVAVAARSKDKAEEFAHTFGAKKAYGSYEELSMDPDVEVVYIGVIHTSHHRLSSMMLNAGKNVVCEKPMTLNLKQAKEILQLAKAKNLFFMEAYWSLCFPVYDRIRKELTEGVLGDVQIVTGAFGIPAFGVQRLTDINMAGGGLLDVGCYCIMLACIVFDEMPEKILAEAQISQGVDYGGCIILKYRKGGMASLAYSIRCTNSNNIATIHGTKGYMEIPGPFHASESVTTPSGICNFKLPEGPTPAPFNFTNSTGLAYEADCVRKCLLAGEKQCPLIPHRLSEMIMTIMDECRQQMGVQYDVDRE